MVMAETAAAGDEPRPCVAALEAVDIAAERTHIDLAGLGRAAALIDAAPGMAWGDSLSIEGDAALKAPPARCLDRVGLALPAPSAPAAGARLALRAAPPASTPGPAACRRLACPPPPAPAADLRAAFSLAGRPKPCCACRAAMGKGGSSQQALGRRRTDQAQPVTSQWAGGLRRVYSTIKADENISRRRGAALSHPFVWRCSATQPQRAVRVILLHCNRR